MSKNSNIKRVGLYFNLENELDNKMYAYLTRDGRKAKDEIKKLVEMAMEGIDIKPLVITQVEEFSEDEELNIDDIDPNIGTGF